MFVMNDIQKQKTPLFDLFRGLEDWRKLCPYSSLSGIVQGS